MYRLIIVIALILFGAVVSRSEEVDIDSAGEPADENTQDPFAELSEYFEIKETDAHVVDFAENEEYDTHVIIFEPKEGASAEEETAPYVIKGERPKPSVSFIIGHPDLSVGSKYMTIFMNAPPETLPEDLRRIYYGGRIETEPEVEPTPEHLEGLSKP